MPPTRAAEDRAVPDEGRGRFDRRPPAVAFRNGIAAARVFEFLDQDYVDADEDLSTAQDASTACRGIFLFSRRLRPLSNRLNPYGGDDGGRSNLLRMGAVWGEVAWPNPVWPELRHAFRREGTMRRKLPGRSTGLCGLGNSIIDIWQGRHPHLSFHRQQGRRGLWPLREG